MLVITPPSDDVVAEEGDIDAALLEALQGMPAAKAAATVAKRFGLERSAVYARVTELKGK